jgi:hypothetical protein
MWTQGIQGNKEIRSQKVDQTAVENKGKGTALVAHRREQRLHGISHSTKRVAVGRKSKEVSSVEATAVPLRCY